MRSRFGGRATSEKKNGAPSRRVGMRRGGAGNLVEFFPSKIEVTLFGGPREITDFVGGGGADETS